MGELITIISATPQKEKPFTLHLKDAAKGAMIALAHSLEGVIFDRPHPVVIAKRDLSELEEQQRINRGGRPVLKGSTIAAHRVSGQINLN